MLYIQYTDGIQSFVLVAWRVQEMESKVLELPSCTQCYTRCAVAWVIQLTI